MYAIQSPFYLFRILFPPWSEKSCGLVWAHADDELTLRIPAKVLYCIKMAWYHHSRPPHSLGTEHCDRECILNHRISNELYMTLKLYVYNRQPYGSVTKEPKLFVRNTEKTTRTIRSQSYLFVLVFAPKMQCSMKSMSHNHWAIRTNLAAVET